MNSQLGNFYDFSAYPSKVVGTPVADARKVFQSVTRVLWKVETPVEYETSSSRTISKKRKFRVFQIRRGNASPFRKALR